MSVPSPDNMYCRLIKCSNEDYQYLFLWCFYKRQNDKYDTPVKAFVVLSKTETDLKNKNNWLFEFQANEITFQQNKLTLNRNGKEVKLTIRNMEEIQRFAQRVKFSDGGNESPGEFYNVACLFKEETLDNINEEVNVLFKMDLMDIDVQKVEFTLTSNNNPKRTQSFQSATWEQPTNQRILTTDFEEKREVSKNECYVHFRTKYNELTYESTLIITLTGVDNKQYKTRLELFDNEQKLVCDEQTCLFPTINANYNTKEGKVEYNNNNNKITIVINTNPNLRMMYRRINGIWSKIDTESECETNKIWYPCPSDKDRDKTIQNCEKLEICNNIPMECVKELFAYRYYYINECITESKFITNKYYMLFFVLRSVMEISILSKKDYLHDSIAFIDELLKTESEFEFLENVHFINILPFYSIQTNSLILREEVGNKLMEKVKLEDMIKYIPHIIEIIKNERNENIIKVIGNYIKENQKNESKEIIQQFLEKLLWSISNEIQKKNEYMFKYIDYFNKLFVEETILMKSMNKDARYILHDINSCILLLYLVEKDTKAEEIKEEIKDFSFPFLKGRRITDINKCKVYPSATKPMIISATLDDKKEIMFMAKGQDDLLNDIIVLILSNYIYQELKSQIDLSYLTYEITEMGEKKGIIEFVPDVVELFQLKNDQKTFNLLLNNQNVQGYSKENQLKTLSSNIHKLKYGSVDYTTPEYHEQTKIIENSIKTTYQTRQLNFVKSLALGCVLNYVLKLRDRHSSNIMLQYTTGKLFHIDFGHIFGDDPYLKSAICKEPEITILPFIVEMMKSCHLDLSFRQYAKWAWEKVKFLSNDIATLLTFILYDREDIYSVLDRLREPFELFDTELKITENAVRNENIHHVSVVLKDLLNKYF